MEPFFVDGSLMPLAPSPPGNAVRAPSLAADPCRFQLVTRAEPGSPCTPWQLLPRSE